MQIASGMYVGDGTDGRVIPTGLSGVLVRAEIIVIPGFPVENSFRKTREMLVAESIGDSGTCDGNVTPTGWIWNGTNMIVDASADPPNNAFNTLGLKYVWVAWSE